MEKRHNFLQKNANVIGVGLMILFCLGMTMQYFWTLAPFGTKNASPSVAAVSVPDFSDATARLSRNDITRQIVRLTENIARMEKTDAIKGPMGVEIYSPETSSRLVHDYQQIQLRVDFLAKGPGSAKNNGNVNWGEYVLKNGQNRPFTVAEIVKSLQVLEQYPQASNFLTGFRIFTLPYTIPDVSGLGGAGFSMLSAAGEPKEPGDPNDYQSSLEEQLRVTLYHEIGHHLHLSLMPEDTAAGKSLWQEYLSLRGGTWHGPGKVKTEGWSNSSEETFAEDFRMIFGKDQPYYNDVSLGDPRNDPAQAAEIRNFMKNLAKKPMAVDYQSPWMPENLSFWKCQPIIIVGVWVVLGVGAIIINRQQTDDRKRTTSGSRYTDAV